MADAEEQQDETINSLRMQLDGIERGLEMWEAKVRDLNGRMDAVEAKRP